MIQTKQKSRWRGQQFRTVGMIDNYYIAEVGKKKFLRIHKREVVKDDERRDLEHGCRV